MIHIAIRNIHSNVGVVTGSTVDDVVCTDTDGNSVTIDKSAVSAEITKLENAYNDLAYSRARQAEYPDWGSQLNKIYDDGVTKWKSEMVDPVKAKWPKDNSGPI